MNAWRNKKGTGIIVIKMILFPWVNYPKLLFIHYFCQCGTGSYFRGIVLGVIFWGQDPCRVTLTPLLNPWKTPDPIMDCDDGHISSLKIRVGICTRMDVVQVEYVTLAHMSHLIMWLFQFITGITFRWDSIMWLYVYLFVGISRCTLLRIYKVSIDPVKCFFDLRPNWGSIKFLQTL